MKKYLVICAGLCVALAFSSCKSKESAYRKAYDKAKAQDAAVITENNGYDDTPVVTPFVDTPVTENNVVTNEDNVQVRSENLTVVNGSGLKAYSVVVGSFSVKSNAESLVSRLRSQGYDAQLAYNSARDMYRVVASSYADKASAIQSRTRLRDTYPDAWLLYYGY
jgi:cell division protein FtsN